MPQRVPRGIFVATKERGIRTSTTPRGLHWYGPQGPFCQGVILKGLEKNGITKNRDLKISSQRVRVVITVKPGPLKHKR